MPVLGGEATGRILHHFQAVKVIRIRANTRAHMHRAWVRAPDGRRVLPKKFRGELSHKQVATRRRNMAWNYTCDQPSLVGARTYLASVQGVRLASWLAAHLPTPLCSALHRAGMHAPARVDTVWPARVKVVVLLAASPTTVNRAYAKAACRSSRWGREKGPSKCSARSVLILC